MPSWKNTDPKLIKQAAYAVSRQAGLDEAESLKVADATTEKLTRPRDVQRVADRKFVKAITRALVKQRHLKSYPVAVAVCLEALAEVYPDIQPEKFRKLLAKLERQADNAALSSRTA